MQTITLSNIKEVLINNENPIEKSRVYGSNKKNEYRLLKSMTIELSNGEIHTISNGFKWDLASVPSFLQGIIKPDSDAEIAFLIHDYLYVNKIVSQRFADHEMLKWERAVNGTLKWSFRNIDNYLRFWAVRCFGKRVWNN